MAAKQQRLQDLYRRHRPRKVLILMLENILAENVCPMLLKGLKCPVSKLVSSDACPRATAQAQLADGTTVVLVGREQADGRFQESHHSRNRAAARRGVRGLRDCSLGSAQPRAVTPFSGRPRYCIRITPNETERPERK
jgi:hypothetical protein